MLLVAPSSPEKRAAHQRHMRQTPEALWVWIATLSLHTFRPSTVSLRAPAGPGTQTVTLL